ncbi:MAG: helix-turn-helix domain containing protein [Candidatus Aenigmarchaeota archaeon]|nr:helix-turn-helix domain containing protein [Candidatus Aenigmarchaeota archaeon]
MLRRGREVYSKHYEEALRLHNQGVSVQEIAKKLNVSYSAAYHWVKGLRKPEQGNVNEFLTYLEKNGPMPVTIVKEKFPKHNELFLIASRRAMPVKRHMLVKKYGDYATWYYLEGQEKLLDSRLKELVDKVKEVKEKLGSILK